MNLDKKYFGTVCSVSYNMTITTTPITTCYVLYLVKVSGMKWNEVKIITNLYLFLVYKGRLLDSTNHPELFPYTVCNFLLFL